MRKCIKVKQTEKLIANKGGGNLIKCNFNKS